MGFRGGEGERRKRGGDGKGRCGKRAEIGGGPREEGSEGERGGEGGGERGWVPPWNTLTAGRRGI